MDEFPELGAPSQGSSQNTTNNNQSRTYSTVAAQNKFNLPSKKQAIVFSALDNTKVEEYLYAIGNKIQPQNILFISRISNNRICIYLSSEAIVEKFLNTDNGSVVVNQQIIQGRRLINANERLIISNVCLTIPHLVIEDALKRIGLSLVTT
ncbi:unnamed protein product [Psylliodes chrysocephalus]|uniref:Uncharacterized protein n=1 Tax=Psylliodes chrysocephalus TaxID=3402493 RepID=A0A9P0CWE3_9CUCU|nr:unnamed protein product [Psylliodes chrysocephala]